MEIFEIHDVMEPYVSFWRSEDPSLRRWQSKIEGKAPYIYSKIVGEYGYASELAKPMCSLEELTIRTEKMRPIVHDQVERLSVQFGLREKVGDVHLVPLIRAAPSLTGCWTDFQYAPMCIVGFDSFFDHLNYFAVISSHEMTHAFQSPWSDSGSNGNFCTVSVE